MLFNDVNVPEGLIAANSDGKLVVFAGAGISMAPPSGLPDFNRLADAVAEDVLTRGKDEPVDRFLGRLERKGVDVQARVRKLIGNPLSQPGPLHKTLCDLPGSTEKLRIVTTNFDTHLTTTARARYGSTIDVFSAPALPLGRDFWGVVHLHGSIARREPLTITDADFGRAYLADGWATRFLLEMFERFTVLFVGYSHSDVVMQYLARGFVNASERFALAPAGENEHWAYLGITPINYPLQAPPDEHGAVRDSIKAWALHASLGVLDHERRIQTAVTDVPPIDPDAIDYVASMMQDPVTLRLFTKYAVSTEWLDWAENRGVLDPLFSADVGTDDRVEVLAEWFATRFVLQHAGKALEIIERHGQSVSGALWFAVGRALTVAAPRPSPEILARWALILTQKALPAWRPLFLDRLLAEARAAEELESGVLLFQFLARPRMAFDRLGSLWKDDTGKLRLHVEIALVGDGHDLRRAWSDFFLPHMAHAYKHLVPMLTGYIEYAHRIISTAGSGDSIWDPMSFHRSAIEPHGQDAHPDSWEFLVDAARDVLEWMLRNVPGLGTALVDLWSVAEAPLLRRLSVHGVSLDTQLTADQKVMRIQERNWLHSFPLKHEVFHLLKGAFAGAGPDVQRAFVEYAKSVSVAPESRDGESRRIDEYEQYNLAAWLHSVAPASDIAKSYFEDLQAAHADFEPREHPDFDHWMGPVGFISPKSPISPGELVERPISEVVRWLLTYHPERTVLDGPDRDGMLGAVREAGLTSFPWSIDIANELIRQGEFKSDLWQAICDGWRDGKLEPVHWQGVLELLAANPELDVHGGVIVDLLERAADQKGEGSDHLVRLVESLVDRLLAASNGPSALVGGTTKDWLTRAVNQIGGRLSLVLLKLLSRNRAEHAPQMMPVAYRERLDRLIDAQGNNGTYARIVIASQVNYLFALDTEWSERRIVPLFDWDRDPVVAAQAWAGFASWGQWSETLFEKMLPYSRKMFRHLDDELVEDREHLCLRLAGAAAFSQRDPWHGGWIRDLIRDATPSSITPFVTCLTRVFDDLSDQGEKKVWNGWLKDYWSERLEGIPRPLSGQEIEQMFLWTIGLRSEFEAVVEMCERTPPPGELDHFLFYQLNESGAAKEYPVAMGRLLRHLLSSVKKVEYGCDYLFNLGKTAWEGGAAREDLLIICDGMARLGCPSASDLRRLIDGPRGDTLKNSKTL